TINGISCSATITGMYVIPAGPFASQPLASYIANCELTHREDHSGTTRFQNWFRFQNVFQNASQPKTRCSGFFSVCLTPSALIQSPLTSFQVFLLQIDRYILL